mgnify:FL=1
MVKRHIDGFSVPDADRAERQDEEDEEADGSDGDMSGDDVFRRCHQFLLVTLWAVSSMRRRSLPLTSPNMPRFDCRILNRIAGAEDVFIKFAFPFGHRCGHRKVAGHIRDGAHHVKDAVEREQEGDDQDRLVR